MKAVRPYKERRHISMSYSPHNKLNGDKTCSQARSQYMGATTIRIYREDQEEQADWERDGRAS